MTLEPLTKKEPDDFSVFSFCYQIQSLQYRSECMSSMLMFNSGSIVMDSHGDASHSVLFYF